MKRIAISAGHFPEKAGARYGGLVEHDLANTWIDIIFDVFDSIFDFDKDEPLFDLVPVPTGTLKEKVAFINRHDFDYAIELHFNSAHVVATGCETLHMPGSFRGKEFAFIIQDYMVEALKIRDRGVKEGLYWSSRERTNTPLYFLRRTDCPAVIIEPEFLQSYERTINKQKIVEFAFALISALEETVLEEV